METVVGFAILIIVAFAVMQLSGSVIKFIWKTAPTILFIALVLAWFNHKVEIYERTKNAEHTGLTQVEGTSGQQAPKWLYDKVFPATKSGSQSKQD